jgi:hypothetical protein
LPGLSEIRFNTHYVTDTPTATLTTSGANIVPGTWYHIAADKDSGGTVRIYINGVMKARDTPVDSRISAGVEHINLGDAGTVAFPFGSRFIGNIDDVRITTRSRYGDLYGDASFTPPSQFPDHA